MVDFVKKLIKDIVSQEEQIAYLISEYNNLKNELYDLESYIPEEGIDFEKEMEKIDAKIHSVNLKMRYIKEALIEFDSLELIEKKDTPPKVQFTIHNEKIKKREDVDEEDYEEDDDEDIEETLRDTGDVEERYVDEDDQDEEDYEEDEEENNGAFISSEKSFEVPEVKEEIIENKTDSSLIEREPINEESDSSLEINQEVIQNKDNNEELEIIDEFESNEDIEKFEKALSNEEMKVESPINQYNNLDVIEEFKNEELLIEENNDIQDDISNQELDLEETMEQSSRELVVDSISLDIENIEEKEEIIELIKNEDLEEVKELSMLDTDNFNEEVKEVSDQNEEI